jgi:hypothetical protein
LLLTSCFVLVAAQLTKQSVTSVVRAALVTATLRTRLPIFAAMRISRNVSVVEAVEDRTAAEKHSTVQNTLRGCASCVRIEPALQDTEAIVNRANKRAIKEVVATLALSGLASRFLFAAIKVQAGSNVLLGGN